MTGRRGDDSNRLRAVILGAAAGGGLPQWNCGCDNCRDARLNHPDVPPQTQSSIAVSADGVNWALLNASPDIRQQINATPALHPRARRDTPINSVLLTNGDIDHVAGLLILREKQAFTLFMTSEIAQAIADNPIFNALDADLVERRVIGIDAPIDLAPGLTARLFPVPGKVPLYLEGETVQTDLEGEQTVGVELSAHGQTAYYIPGCAKLTPALETRLRGAALLFFDGTVWVNDEMRQQGVGAKTGARMGHMAMQGPDGSIEGLRGLHIKRKIYVHMNNTNPVLRRNSAQRAMAVSAGWEIGEDGMEITL